MKENSNRNRSIRVIIALLLVVAIIYVYNTQDDPFKSPEKLKEELTKEDLLQKNSPILNPRNIKGHMLPHSIKYVGSRWLYSYKSDAVTHLLTQLQSELAEEISSRPRFSSDKYMESARYRWKVDERKYSKEFSLHLLELLYRVSGSEDYLSILFEESEDLINDVKGTLDIYSHLSRHEIFKRSNPYPFIRLISFRSSMLLGKNEIPREKIMVLYNENKIKIKKKEESQINESCKALWSVSPILATDSEFSKNFGEEIEEVYLDFKNALKKDRDSIDSLLDLNYCLVAFLELQDLFKTPPEPAFELAYQKYIIDTFNYPFTKGCPRSGGFFTRPPEDGNCQTEKMYLYQNVFLEYILYNLNK